MEGDKRKGIGNIHTHHIMKDAVPNNLSKQQTKGYSESFITSLFGKILGNFIYGENFNQFVRILESKSIREVGKHHIESMKYSEIDYSIISSLDFSEIDPKYDGYNIRYTKQMKDIAANCAAHPFHFFQFFFFEPRRPNVRDLLDEAYKDYGIVGIKFYPAFGFDPRPEKDDFIVGKTKVTSIRKNLEFMYSFAEKEKLADKIKAEEEIKLEKEEPEGLFVDFEEAQRRSARIENKLKEPFKLSEVKWRAGMITQDKT